MTSLLYYETGTTHAGSKEWLEASKNMIIVSYVGARAAVPSASTTTIDEPERYFGSHIKETVDAFMRLIGKKHLA